STQTDAKLTLSSHDALPIYQHRAGEQECRLSEADHTHGLVDDHEAEGHQGVGRAGAEADADGGEELGHHSPARAYMSSTRSWNIASMARRFTFWVAVSSPSSWSSSLGSIAKALICSTVLCRALTSLTTESTSSRTSGFSARSR